MIYTFGRFAMDTGLFELRRDGEVIAVEPLVFNLLLCLIENRDRIVTRDDLAGAVWQGRAIADTTISSRIFALRHVLGDANAGQSCIRTVPRRGFRFVATVECTADCPAPGPPSEGPPEPAISGLSPARIPKLLVLPFRPASAGTDRFLCDGMAEDLIGNLARFRELQVFAGGTAFHFRASAMSPVDIARQLGAGFIVSGSVRNEEGRLRVMVQLADAAAGVILWAGHYDRQAIDVFAVQDEMSRMVAAALGVRIQDAGLTRALLKSPPELDAYGCLLRARRYTSSLDDAEHAEARGLLERAVALDPGYAEAHALLANVYLAEYRFGANPCPDPLGRALSAAIRATELDPQSAYARCWLAITHFFCRDNDKFDAEMQRAVGLNPNDPEILAEAGHYYSFAGDYGRGVAYSDRARLLNPMHPGWYHFANARRHYSRRDYEAVLIDVARVGMPDFYWSHLLRAAALGQLGREGAAAALARIGALRKGLSPIDEISKWNACDADLVHLAEGLRKAGLPG
ncbi:winged helix-turn-helix domain-containing protein [Mangrovicoccus sp. HB161399]|uniref:winged helix-turn-helix domain-containing protein n=1 Tax=Mangrovicoccus sp. HB161399 TaxID=2720392 RepID=UPI001551D8D4|nr:winged helix-turn-helix domain-containing protein [Mangrovicoccus sp. HB161399]